MKTNQNFKKVDVSDFLVNVEHDVYYDWVFAQILFDENFIDKGDELFFRVEADDVIFDSIDFNDLENSAALLGLNEYYSHGYSQGDVRRVFFKGEDDSSVRRYIDNLLWDAPIDGTIKINFTKEHGDFTLLKELELNVNECLTDEYDAHSFDIYKAVRDIRKEFIISEEQENTIHEALIFDYDDIK